MRINRSTLVEGDRVCLVPYREEHVEKYHRWMQSEELQTLTASEPLSLEEEYDMQQAWLNDANKCTFIVLDKSRFEAKSCISSEVEAMCGDVNLFLNDPSDSHSAEVEIMIAEPLSRGKGFGKEALLAMCRYGVDNLGLNNITAKIGLDNSASLKMFEKLGFKEMSCSEVFQEVTLSLSITENTKEWLYNLTKHLKFEETVASS